LDAPIECLNVCVGQTVPLAHILGDNGNARQQILDTIIQGGDEQTLLILGLLARGDVNGEAFDAY
jgi:hypothetical protein